MCVMDRTLVPMKRSCFNSMKKMYKVKKFVLIIKVSLLGARTVA